MAEGDRTELCPGYISEGEADANTVKMVNKQSMRPVSYENVGDQHPC